MDTIKHLNFGIMVVFFACYAYQFFYIPIALWKKQKHLSPGVPHRFAVLIAARNEETVIGDLIDSLRGQDYPSELVHIYVVADNCVDKTAEIAAAHGARVYKRFDRSHTGKGYALQFLLERLPESYDAYLVFDADNVLAPDYLSQMNRTFSAGYEVITSYRNSKNYGDNWISAGYGLWFLREAQYLNRARAVLGTSCAVSGTGFLFSRQVLEQVGGWHFFLLTEDIEFTAHCISHGIRIGYCPDAVFYDEQPTDLGQSVIQRIRWVQGYLQVLGRYGGRLLKGCLGGSFSCFDMLMSIAPAAILSWLSILLNLLSAVLRYLQGADVGTVLLSVGQSLLNLCLTVLLLGLITTLSEWRRIPCSTGRKILCVFTFPLFMLTYLPVCAAALVCRPGWKPIVHCRKMAPSQLPQGTQTEYP